jgi:hypothetical protein
MENKEKLNLWQRIIEKTPKKNKRRGQLMTAIGTAAGIVLASGVVTAPIGVVILSITAALTGGIAFSDATKIVNKDGKDN